MSRGRGVVGLASAIAGTGALVAALARPAAGWESEKEPTPVEETDSLGCADLAEKFGLDVDWTEFKIDVADLPAEGESQTYDITDTATVTIQMVVDAKAFDWTSTVGIDAVYVKGGHGSAFYGYQPDVNENGELVGPGEESFGDTDIGTFPYWAHDKTKNQISHITFCYDDEDTTSTTSPSTTDSSTPPSTAESTTTSIEDTTTLPPDESPTTTASVDHSGGTTTVLPAEIVTSQDALPKTGSDSSGPLLALGGLLVAGGGALLATTRMVRRRQD